MGRDEGAQVVEAVCKMVLCSMEAASCPGWRQCHSSMCSFKNRPGMSRGTKAPVGSITFPSTLCFNFPAKRYSSTRSQFRMKCPFPQKAQSSLRGAVFLSEGAARCRCRVLLIAAIIDFVNSAKIMPSCTVLTTGSRVEDEGVDTVDGKRGDVERVL